MTTPAFIFSSTAGGATITVSSFFTLASPAGSMWSPWMSVTNTKSALGRPSYEAPSSTGST